MSIFVALNQPREDPCMSYDIHKAPDPKREENILTKKFQLVRFAEPEDLRTHPHTY